MNTHELTETWTVALSANRTGCDTLWRSDSGRYCCTDRTHPRDLDCWGDDHHPVENYILDLQAIENDEVKLDLSGSKTKYIVLLPRHCGRPAGQTARSAALIIAQLLFDGAISKLPSLYPHIQGA